MVSVQPGMQANAQQVHDDLANLFSRNMTFNPEFHTSTPKETPRQEPAIPAQAAQPIVYSISQHYHHSAHIVKPPSQEPQHEVQFQSQRPSSEPPQSELSPTEQMLRNYGIDPTILTPAQLSLFRIADEPQKLRLLELWSICPPNKAEDIPALAWSSTNLDQEEHLARMRYERQQNPTMSLDGTTVQTGNGTWAQPHVAADSEPYMISGYEELMRREYDRQSVDNKARDIYNHYGNAVGSNRYTRSTDPVYKGPDYSEQQQLQMASQYGAFQQFGGGSMECDAMDM